MVIKISALLFGAVSKPVLVDAPAILSHYLSYMRFSIIAGNYSDYPWFYVCHSSVSYSHSPEVYYANSLAITSSISSRIFLYIVIVKYLIESTMNFLEYTSQINDL